MSNPSKIKIGILGGIGSGKSMVAQEFAKLNCAVSDADEIAHELLQEPEVKKRIISVFGRRILADSQTIDRARLGRIVFADREKLKELTDILHPLVFERIYEQIGQYNMDEKVKAVVLDMPLLMETGWHRECDSLVFVECDEDKRYKRGSKNAHLDENQLKMRENFQISLDIKASIAENTIDNNSDISALSRQVAELFPKLVQSN
jgi:dephospho-CoA kinase